MAILQSKYIHFSKTITILVSKKRTFCVKIISIASIFMLFMNTISWAAGNYKEVLFLTQTLSPIIRFNPFPELIPDSHDWQVRSELAYVIRSFLNNPDRRYNALNGELDRWIERAGKDTRIIELLSNPAIDKVSGAITLELAVFYNREDRRTVRITYDQALDRIVHRASIQEEPTEKRGERTTEEAIPAENTPPFPVDHKKVASIFKVDVTTLKKLIIYLSNEKGEIDINALSATFGIDIHPLTELVRYLGEEQILGSTVLYDDKKKWSWVSYLDVIDEESGEPTGRIRSFLEAHKEGTPHRSAVILVLTEEGKAILQTRTDTDRKDMTASGHVDIGESPETAAYREFVEETGLKDGKFTLLEIKNPLPETNGLFRKTGKNSLDRNTARYEDGRYISYSKERFNNEHVHLFITVVDKETEERLLTARTSEVKGFSLATVDELVTGIKQTPSKYGSGLRQFFEIDEVREKITREINNARDRLKDPTSGAGVGVSIDAPAEEHISESIHGSAASPLEEVASFIKANLAGIKERGAFIFDVDGTLLTQREETLMDYPVLLEAISFLLKENIRVVIVTGGSRVNQTNRIAVPLVHKLQQEGELARIDNLIIYANAGASKVVINEEAQASLSDSYTNFAIIPGRVKEIVKNKLGELGQVKFNLPKEAIEGWRRYYKEVTGFPDVVEFMLPWLDDGEYFPQVVKAEGLKGKVQAPWVEDRDGVQLSIRLLPRSYADSEGIMREYDIRSAVIDEIKTALGDYANELNISIGGSSSIDITENFVSKKHAVENIIKRGKLDPHFVFYFGDEFFVKKDSNGNIRAGNDMPVLEVVPKLNPVSVNKAEDEVAGEGVAWIGSGPEAIAQLFKKLFQSLQPYTSQSGINTKEKVDELYRRIEGEGRFVREAPADYHVYKNPHEPSGLELHIVSVWQHLSRAALDILHEQISPLIIERPEDWLFIVELPTEEELDAMRSVGIEEGILSENKYAKELSELLGIPLISPVPGTYSLPVLERALTDGGLSLDMIFQLVFLEQIEIKKRNKGTPLYGDEIVTAAKSITDLAIIRWDLNDNYRDYLEKAGIEALRASGSDPNYINNLRSQIAPVLTEISNKLMREKLSIGLLQHSGMSRVLILAGALHSKAIANEIVNLLKGVNDLTKQTQSSGQIVPTPSATAEVNDRMKRITTEIEQVLVKLTRWQTRSNESNSRDGEIVEVAETVYDTKLGKTIYRYHYVDTRPQDTHQDPSINERIIDNRSYAEYEKLRRRAHDLQFELERLADETDRTELDKLDAGSLIRVANVSLDHSLTVPGEPVRIVTPEATVDVMIQHRPPDMHFNVTIQIKAPNNETVSFVGINLGLTLLKQDGSPRGTTIKAVNINNEVTFHGMAPGVYTLQVYKRDKDGRYVVKQSDPYNYDNGMGDTTDTAISLTGSIMTDRKDTPSDATKGSLSGRKSVDYAPPFTVAPHDILEEMLQIRRQLLRWTVSRSEVTPGASSKGIFKRLISDFFRPGGSSFGETIATEFYILDEHGKAQPHNTEITDSSSYSLYKSLFGKLEELYTRSKTEGIDVTVALNPPHELETSIMILLSTLKKWVTERPDVIDSKDSKHTLSFRKALIKKIMRDFGYDIRDLILFLGETEYIENLKNIYRKFVREFANNHVEVTPEPWETDREHEKKIEEGKIDPNTMYGALLIASMEGRKLRARSLLPLPHTDIDLIISEIGSNADYKGHGETFVGPGSAAVIEFPNKKLEEAKEKRAEGNLIAAIRLFKEALSGYEEIEAASFHEDLRSEAIQNKEIAERSLRDTVGEAIKNTSTEGLRAFKNLERYLSTLGTDLTPVDIIIDTSLIDTGDPNILSENIKTLAYIIAVYSRLKNVNFIFELPDIPAGAWISEELKKERRGAKSGGEIAKEVKKAIEEISYLLGPENNVSDLLNRVNAPRRDKNIEIPFHSVTYLEWLRRETAKGRMVLNENQYPVALSGFSGINDHDLILRSFQAAFTVGLIKAVLVIARDNGGLDEDLKKTLLKNLREIYRLFRSNEVELNEEVLDYMVMDPTGRLNQAIYLYLPPITGDMSKKIVNYQNAIQLILQAA